MRPGSPVPGYDPQRMSIPPALTLRTVLDGWDTRGGGSTLLTTEPLARFTGSLAFGTVGEYF